MFERGHFLLFLLLAKTLQTSTDAFIVPPKPYIVHHPLRRTYLVLLDASGGTDWDIQFRMLKHSLLRVVAAIFLIPPETLSSAPMMEPPPSSSYDLKRRKASSFILSDGWCNNVLAVDHATIEEKQYVDDVMGATTIEKNYPGENNVSVRPSTYGEVTTIGARQLFFYMGMTQTNKEEGGMTFFDLGSGAGKLVVQAYMEVPHLCRVVGVELSPSRHQDAMQAWKKIRTEAERVRSINPVIVELEEINCSLDLFEGDMFKLDLSDATHVYVASLCFTPEMMQALAEKMDQEASKLQCFATLQPIRECWEKRFGRPRVEFVEMSWTKTRGEGCPVYFYTIKHPGLN